MLDRTGPPAAAVEGADQIMDPAGLERLAFFAGLPRWALELLAGAAREEEVAAGRTVLHQHDRVRTVLFLVGGALQILVRVGDDDLLVGVLGGRGELVGWSAFRPPYRSTATVRCERPSRLVAVPAAAFEELFTRDPALGYLLLGRVAASVADRLEQTRELLLTATAPGATRERP
jgi:CRP-like cAMP-binding protein